MKYPFRREDNGKIVEVDFETMMQQDVAGFIRLPDGTSARRVSIGKGKIRGVTRVEGNKQTPPSDAMGFTAHQLAEMEQHRKANGFTGVEFVKDPLCDTFYQVKCSSDAERRRYMRSRGFYDRGGDGGAVLNKDLLEKAKERILQKT